MTVDDEMLFAFIDGTLDRGGMQAVATAVVSDPALALRVDRQVLLAREVRAEMDRDLALPVPDAWIAAIDARLEPPVANMAGLAAARMREQIRLKPWHAGGAIAALLAIGIAAGMSNGASAGPPGLIGEQDGRLFAGAELALALDTARSGRLLSLKDGATVDIRLSLRARDGRYCRLAAVSGRDGVSVLACHSTGGWAIAALDIQPQADRSGYVHDPLQAAIDRLGGNKLDGAAEIAAIDNAWRAEE